MLAALLLAVPAQPRHELQAQMTAPGRQQARWLLHLLAMQPMQAPALAQAVVQARMQVPARARARVQKPPQQA